MTMGGKSGVFLSLSIMLLGFIDSVQLVYLTVLQKPAEGSIGSKVQKLARFTFLKVCEVLFR